MICLTVVFQDFKISSDGSKFKLDFIFGFLVIKTLLGILMKIDMMNSLMNFQAKIKEFLLTIKI